MAATGAGKDGQAQGDGTRERRRGRDDMDDDEEEEEHSDVEDNPLAVDAADMPVDELRADDGDDD